MNPYFKPFGIAPRFIAATALGALALVAHPEPASACGGLFCSNTAQVNQAAERIIFASNGDGNVTAVIQILYEGPAEEFSWILPVPGNPDVSISSDAAFARLQQASNPTYQLQTTFEDNCGQTNFVARGSADSADGSATLGAPSVEVVASGSVGPFNFEVISVDNTLPDPADVAVEWLEANNYDVAPNGPDTLRPYLESGMNLIGFQLIKGNDTGSIRPVVLAYQTDLPMIPIRPTAVAANDDMGVMVWVLGSSRAVPINYRALELNETLINWLNPQSNYNDVVIAAADEAGGQGFVTEQSGPAGEFADTIWQPAEQAEWERIQAADSPIQVLLNDAAMLFGQLDGFTDVVRDTVPLRQGVSVEDFVQCVSCYYQAVGVDPFDPFAPPLPDTEPSAATDRAAFFAALESNVIGPMQDTRALFEDYGHVTRLYTTLSAEEMTLDPQFDFNPELGDVDNVHIATRTMSCSGDGWRAQLPQGQFIVGQGQDWPVAMDGLPANRRVLQLSTSGEGEVIEDNSELIDSQFRDSGGCGCRTAPHRTGGFGALGALALALGLFVSRRRF